jgi:hypothetical protein
MRGKLRRKIMSYEIIGIAKNGKCMRHLRPTSANAKILAQVMIEKGAKSVKIKEI